MAADDDPSFRIPDQVLNREVDGQMVLLDLDSEQYFGLDEVGAVMVHHLTTEPFDTAIGSLEAAFDVDPARLRADLDDLVATLLDAGLLVRVGGAG